MRVTFSIIALFLARMTLAAPYDIVLEGGRVLDPASGLDAIRNVGIVGDKIGEISAQHLPGRRSIDARGLVIAPGFIDLHQHSQDEESGRLKAFDGVTSALEMEIGAPDVAAFLSLKKGKSLINYGTTASHSAARARAFGAPLAYPVILPRSGPATNDPVTPAQMRSIEDRLRSELDAGGLGIGMGIQYTPGTTRLEVIQVFRLAAENNVAVYTHVRSAGRVEPGSSIESVGEVIAAAAISGASLHIVHINSSCLADAQECLALVAGARARGLNVTTEAYPYVAGMTYISSALFNPGWQQKFGIDYDALQLPDSGERLTKKRFEELRTSPDPLTVLLFMNRQEVVDGVIANPLVMIASDGELGHPRNAGTFTSILARYVRNLGTVTLMDAIRKMSLMPAQTLEKSTPAAHSKGRLEAGADADIVAFDPLTVVDHATYAAPREPSSGMKYVIVGGTVLIDRGKLVPGIFPGRAITR